MRKLVYIALTLAVLGIFVAVFAYINQDKLIDRFIERQSRGIAFRYEMLDDQESIQLVTVGTGSPLPSDRVQSCNAVFVNGHFLVFDVGEGSSQKMEDLRLPIDKVEAVFITHWHADHFIDLPNLMNRSWILGRMDPLAIYGPGDVDSIIHDMSAMLKLEKGYRVSHHGPEIMNVSSADVRATSISLQGTEASLVFDKDGIKVFAFLVDHAPVKPALGYRLEYDDKILVISGDTKKSDNVTRHAKNADILLHEAMQMDLIKRAAELQARLGNERNAKIATDILEYHTSPQEAAEVARDAQVKKLVLTHLAPAPENPVSRKFFRSGIDKIFSGPVLLAEDGDLYVIN